MCQVMPLTSQPLRHLYGKIFSKQLIEDHVSTYSASSYCCRAKHVSALVLSRPVFPFLHLFWLLHLTAIAPPHKACKDSHQNDNHIQDVPDAGKVLELVDTQLQNLFHHIVEDEYTEDNFTGNNEKVPRTDISYQLDCPDLPGRNGTTSGWKLNH